MQRVLFSGARRAYSASSRVLAAEAAPAAAGTNLVLNFCTPHTPIHQNKVVDKVILPGEGGEYGITFGHSPIISQLKPGVVTVIHTAGETEKYFVSGGFAITHANSVTDVSVTEAFPVADFDEAAVKTGYSEAVRAAGSSADGSIAKAKAQIEVNTYSALARAIGITL